MARSESDKAKKILQRADDDEAAKKAEEEKKRLREDAQASMEKERAAADEAYKRADAKHYNAQQAVKKAMEVWERTAPGSPDRANAQETVKKAVAEADAAKEELDKAAAERKATYKKKERDFMEKKDDQDAGGVEEADGAAGADGSDAGGEQPEGADGGQPGDAEGGEDGGNKWRDSDASKKATEIAKGAGKAAAGAVAGAAGMIGNLNAGLMNAKDPTGKSAHERAEAETDDRESAQHGMNAQKHAQVANSNYRVEAEKNAMAGAAAENAQKVANMGNASAGAAALERGVKAADYDTHMNRADEQQKQAEDEQREQFDYERNANDSRQLADMDDYLAQQKAVRNFKSDIYSEGKPDSGEGTDSGGESGGNDGETGGNDGDGGEAGDNPDGQDGQGGQGEEPQESGPPSGNAQHVINWLLGSSRGQDVMESPDKDLAMWVQSEYGVQPMAPGSQASDDPNQWEAEFTAKGGKYAEAMQALRQGRAGKGGNAAANGVRNAEGKLVSEGGADGNLEHDMEGTNSDMRIKNIVGTLSGIRY